MHLVLAAERCVFDVGEVFVASLAALVGLDKAIR
jgi:hypothetical protein